MEQGVALLLVITVIALVSIIVVNLAYTANLDAHSNQMVQRGLRAEYLLKSAVNVARALIQYDASPTVDGKQDIWADGILPFSSGAILPNELLGIAEPGVRIQLEIRPVDAAILLESVLNDSRWREVLHRLFQSLGFDEDGEVDHTGLMPGQVLNSEQMIGALIDYMDRDTESFRDDIFVGMEGQLGDDSPFRNDGTIRRVGELSLIPGFTPNRMQRLTPFVRTEGMTYLNINFVPPTILRAVDPDLGEAEVEKIIAYREGDGEGPFGEQEAVLKTALTRILGEEVADRIGGYFRYGSSRFQVLAKVDYGNSIYFMRAIVTEERNGEPPVIRSVEMF